ncbi:hypothetical protein [Mycobacteroides abscessus]|uniref:hypothetical protein n=1 Tax=Mycobacteroides abscessus TaxID=36809 RepID=UPI0009A5B8E2|nr:hypothetical protein [Mycobacteroides abscessus]MBN7317872.1 hypothetical protein [Mycobacteroides abscessus subsp. massiliense]QSM01852.1 hypothetical protein PROPHIGD79-1_63 [Mycobacterium phage prophi79-1]SLF56453.1 Uncharacterised protein [Mycobacteroides abscessus subsp. bolletii]SLH42943.1 Uncharacterised protein [Mycobacteroides abscessus subsp. massiliense]
MKLYDRLTLAMAAGALVMAGAIADPAGATPTVIPTPATPSVVHSVPASEPEEDEPGWDCATMGNRICGPEGDR